ncbi:MAG: hypothetical protein HZA50_09990, partial [Planctomycetes bacterium]|nr:hypothetical protein [Planctomycetota bacterium]
KEKDLEPVDVPKDVQNALGEIVKVESKEQIIDKEMLQKVEAKQFAMHWHYQKDPERERVGKEEVAITVDLSTAGSIGNVLKIGDKVNLVGFFSIGAGQQAQACRIIGGVRVIAIGGKGESVKRGPNEEGATGYRQITIAVTMSGKDDVALQLRNVLTHAIGGGIMVELAGDNRKETGTINPQLSNLKDRAAVRSTSGGG